MCERCEDYHENHVAFGLRYGELMKRECDMTYHDAQGNEIEDLEMDKMRQEPPTVIFWIVTRPTQHSTLNDILFESTPKGMILQGLGGLSPDEILFSSLSYEDARSFAEEQLLRTMEPRTDDDGLDSVFV